MDMLFEVNVSPVSPKVGARLIYFLSQLGHYALPDGPDDYVCTTGMIDTVVALIKPEIGQLSTFDKVDLGIALMVIPIPPALELANLCLADISENDFIVGCHDLLATTDYSELYVDEPTAFAAEDAHAIGIIAQYLYGIAGPKGIDGKMFRKKFNEITRQIRSNMYGSQQGATRQKAKPVKVAETRLSSIAK